MTIFRSFLSGINGSDEDGKEVDDNKEGNENDDDYSSDFEESNASMRGSPRARQRGGQANGAIEKKLSVSVEEDYGPELLAESFPSALGSHPLPSYPSSIPSSAPLLQRPPSTGRPEEERKENSDDVLQAEMALQPLRSSLAKSLLSSQARIFSFPFPCKYYVLRVIHCIALNNRNYSGAKSNLYVCACRCPHQLVVTALLVLVVLEQEESPPGYELHKLEVSSTSLFLLLEVSSRFRL